ncbi:MAG: hypothetical protein IKN48_02950 [Bacteroidaceae bacterium]|nr:hypothetical protein [Bacteroidaceae bacterium]
MAYLHLTYTYLHLFSYIASFGVGWCRWGVGEGLYLHPFNKLIFSRIGGCGVGV